MHTFTTRLILAAALLYVGNILNAEAASELEEECRSSIQFGGNYTWTRVSPKGLDSTSGNLGGIQAKYEYKFPNAIYAGATFAWRQGNTEDGYERTIAYIDAEERLGYTFDTWCDCWRCSLFTGFGYRHYGEKVTSSGDEVTFNYNEFYIPVGFLASAQVNSAFNVGLNFQWMPQVYPTVKITPLNGARWILTNEIENFRVEVPFTFTVSQKYQWFVVFEPFFEYWKDGRSTARSELGTALDIPQNTYLFAGANLNVGCSF